MKLEDIKLLHIYPSDLRKKDALLMQYIPDCGFVIVHENITVEAFILTDLWAGIFPTLSHGGDNLIAIITEHDPGLMMIKHNIQFRNI